MSKKKKDEAAAERAKRANKLIELIKPRDDKASKMKNSNGDPASLIKSLRRPTDEAVKSLKSNPFTKSLKDYKIPIPNKTEE